jgi:hypothetical protein
MCPAQAQLLHQEQLDILPDNESCMEGWFEGRIAGSDMWIVLHFT